MRHDLTTSMGKVVYWALILVTLLISPTITFDPVNPMKVLALTSLAFMGLGMLATNISSAVLNSYRLPLALISFFIFWLFVVFGFSSSEKLQQLFGVSGRNTGLITYLCFSIFFIVSLFASDLINIRKFVKACLIVGSVSIFYGVLQIYGIDPFPWQEIYSPVIGFLGNPNFQSSLIGVLGVVIFTQLFSKSTSTKIKGMFCGYLLISLYVIFQTESQQGFLVLLIGSATSLGVFLFNQSARIGFVYFLSGLIGLVGMIFGILNKGPLATILYKDSVTYRGDYWRAGWNMTLENPIFGVGFDAYGEWYRRSRTLEAAIRRGPDIVSDAAHNVYIDISSSGGLPLLSGYIALMILVLVSSVKVLVREKSFNAGFVSLFAAWIAFQAQSIISINQIGLAIWGWVLAGLIVGYEINTRHIEKTDLEMKRKKKQTHIKQSSPSRVLGIVGGLSIGFLIGLPTFFSSAQHNIALGKTDIASVTEAAYIWPYEPFRIIQVAKTLNDNNVTTNALNVILFGTQKFPDNYAIWNTLSIMTSASPTQKSLALEQMKRLDPLNPNLR